MKKLIFKRLFTLALAIAMLIQMIPVTALATEEEDYVYLEVTTGKTLRVEPYESSEVFAKVEPGDVLIAEDFVTNKYGNLWYKILCPGGDYAFIYNENVKEHTHELVEAGDTLMYCRCGCIVEKKGDTRQIFGDVAALPRPVLGPDDIAALGALWTGLKAGAAAALPYLGVVVACGTVVYLAVSVSRSGIKVDEIASEWEKLDEDFRPEKGVYFEGKVENGFLWIDIANPMDDDSAVVKIEKHINWYNKIKPRNKKTPLWFIYTLDEFHAYDLTEKFISTHPQYTFNSMIDVGGTKDMMNQFKHYHIIPIFEPYIPYTFEDEHMDHMGGHIAFGAPKWGTFEEGAWKRDF